VLSARLGRAGITNKTSSAKAIRTIKKAGNNNSISTAEYYETAINNCGFVTHYQA